MPRLLILLLLKLFTRVGAAFATKITQSLRDWFVNWSNGVVRDAETILDAMGNRYTSLYFRMPSILISLSRAIQQVAAALRQRRQGRGADGRRQVYASSRVLLLFARALFFSFAARCLKIMVCTLYLSYLIADCLVSRRARKIDGRVERRR